MLERLYRLARRLARPVHPRRLAYYVVHGLNLLGVLPFLRRTAVVLHPRRLRATWRFGRELEAASRRRQKETRLTVAVDISAFWEPLTGIGWYLFRLLEHLADRDDVRLRLYGPVLIHTADAPEPVVELPRGRAIEVVSYPVPEELSVDRVALVERLRRRAPARIAADKNDVLFAPNYFLPAWFDAADGALVATVHDLSFRRVPETMRESTRASLAEHLEATLERAARILTDSETVRGELLESGLVEASRVDTVHLGPGPVILGASPDEDTLPAGTPERYVLHVGTLEPRKNLPTLLDAWRLLRERLAPETPPPLVFAGRFGWKTEGLVEAVEAAVAEGWLHHFGYLENAEIATLYRRALFVVLPSIYEGFGLPAVEAMWSGTALLSSDIPVLREVGGAAALYAPPEDPEAWADAAARLLGDEALRTELVAKGTARARQFDWRGTAEGTLSAWQKAAGRGESDKLRE